jgi:mono/diheme cytochrome c family protein
MVVKPKKEESALKRYFQVTINFGFLLMVFIFGTKASAETLLERGTYLMNSIVACGNCHTPRGSDGLPVPGKELMGGREWKGKPFTTSASNLTSHKETGLGGWTDDQLYTAIRTGKRPDGRIIGPPMPSKLYTKISDRDVRAIIAYLRQVKPIKNKVPRPNYRIKLPPAWGPKRSVPEVSRKDKVKYGEYLAGPLGHCIECHTPMVKGRRDFKNQLGAGGFVLHGPKGSPVSANITPDSETGIGKWSDRQIKVAITTGYRASGEKMYPPMAYHFYKNIKPEDLDAIVAYLRSLKPVKKLRKMRLIPNKK